MTVLSTAAAPKVLVLWFDGDPRWTPPENVTPQTTTTTTDRCEPPRLSRRLQPLRGWSRGRINEVPREARERAVRLVFEHEREHPSQWAAITSISAKFGMTPETLRKWVRRAETDEGLRSGLITSRPPSAKTWNARWRSCAPGQRGLRTRFTMKVRPS